MPHKHDLIRSRGIGMTDALWKKITDAAKVRDMSNSDFCCWVLENFLDKNAQKTEKIRAAKENLNRAKNLFDDVKQSVVEGSYDDEVDAG